MSFRIRFQPLCNFDLHHGFFLNRCKPSGEMVEFEDLTEPERNRRLGSFDLYRDLKAHVPNDTERTLSGLGCILKTTPTGFVVAAEVDANNLNNKPVRVPSGPFRLRFTLDLQDSSFLNYTNISSSKGIKKVIYLSNRAGLLNSRFPDLALPQPVYQAGSRYLTGDIVLHGGEYFLSLRTGNHVAPTDADPWRKLGQRSYVSQADEVMVAPRVFMFQPAMHFAAVEKVQLIDQEGLAVGNKLTRFSIGQALRIDASQISTGLYRLEILGNDNSGNPIETAVKIYLDDELARRNTVIVVEIFHVPGDGLGEYRLYDEAADFTLRQPRYSARLLNRHTFWRYRFRNPPTGDLGDLDVDFVTKRSMPLSRDVQQVKLGGEHAVLLPNPLVESIDPEPDRIYSNVYSF